MRVLVAGATGYLGRFLGQALARRGQDVIALVRRPDSLGRPAHDGAPVVTPREVRATGFFSDMAELFAMARPRTLAVR